MSTLQMVRLISLQRGILLGCFLYALVIMYIASVMQYNSKHYAMFLIVNIMGTN